jgi:glycosyltransferase involved in cell wall biosynthesis
VRRQYLAGNPWVPPSGVVTIPNPLGEPRQVVTDRDRARAWLGLDDQFLFVSLGRHAPQKNAYGLMTAFADVARSHPFCHLLVAGRVDDPSYAQQLVQRRERDPGLTNVHLRDHSRATPALLAAADAFVLDSFYEGGPIVTMEALVAGLPVVTSEVGSVAEQIGADGSRGFVVPNPLGSAIHADWDAIGRARYRDQSNRAALAEAMCAVVDDRASWAARREALSLESIERFGADATAVPYASVLREVAGRSATAEPVEALPPLSWRAPARTEG